MNKTYITANELQDWMRFTWHLYASESIRGERLRFWVNNLPEYRVLHGEVVLYEGPDPFLAVAAWNNFK